MDGSRGAEGPLRAEGDDVDTFETTREELRTTFEYQVQRLREIDAKAIEILKANLLLIGIVVTAGSILVQVDLDVTPFLNVFVLAGVALLLVSTGLAGVTYTSSNLRGGLDPDAVEHAIAVRHGDADPTAFRDKLLRSYGRWIAYNARVTAVNDMLATVTVLLVVVAFVYVSAGLVVGVVAPGTVLSAVVFLVLTALLAWLTLLVYRMDHLGPAAPRPADTYDGVMLSKGATRGDGMVALREMLGSSRPDDAERERE